VTQDGATLVSDPGSNLIAIEVDWGVHDANHATGHGLKPGNSDLTCRQMVSRLLDGNVLGSSMMCSNTQGVTISPFSQGSRERFVRAHIPILERGGKFSIRNAAQ